MSRKRGAAGQARLTLAGVAAARGQPERAAALALTAEGDFEAADMTLYAVAARRGRGLVLGGDRGRALVEEADEAMRHEQVLRPDRCAATLAPGFEE